MNGRSLNRLTNWPINPLSRLASGASPYPIYTLYTTYPVLFRHLDRSWDWYHDRYWRRLRRELGPDRHCDWWPRGRLRTELDQGPKQKEHCTMLNILSIRCMFAKPSYPAYLRLSPVQCNWSDPRHPQQLAGLHCDGQHASANYQSDKDANNSKPISYRSITDRCA